MDSRDATSESAESVKTLPPNKLRRSCELCRASKGKCMPSQEDKTRCQKCLKERKPCVFSEAKPRPKRAKNSRTRVAEMEQRLDGLLALLSSTKQGSEEMGKEDLASPAPPEPSTSRRTEGPPLGASSEMLDASMSSRVSTQIPRKFSQPRVLLHSYFDGIEDVISKGILSFQDAEDSLRAFRAKAYNFPFVVLPSHISLDFMRREKPFLLLTILAWGAHETFKLQKTLELELIEQLSRKAVVNGEKSSDLLQGILVYLCWYQFYFKPQRQQIYQLSQMATSMAVDLGIDQPVRSTSQQNNFAIFNSNPSTFNSKKSPENILTGWNVNLGINQAQSLPQQNSSGILNASPQAFHPTYSPQEIEIRRTFLGCYWLSSSVALSLRKPTSLKYTAYTEQCTQILAQVADAETDYLLPHFIALQKFAEDVNHAFDYNSAHLHPQLDSTRVEILHRAFAQQLDQLHSSFPPNVWNNVQISMSFRSLHIYINEVGFHASPPSAMDLMSGQSNLKAWYFSPVRNEILIACLQASKNYLDRFIELTPHETLDLISPDHLRLGYAVLVLGRFTTGCDCPVFDVSYIRRAANMGYYLDRLIEKADDLIMLCPDREVNDFCYHLRTLWKQSKQWFDEIAIDPTTARQCVIQQTALTFMDLLPSTVEQCLDLSGVNKSYEERWTDMLDWELSA